MGDLSLMAFVTPFDGVRNFATVYIKKNYQLRIEVCKQKSSGTTVSDCDTI